jgi:hypothetical protein
MDFTLNNMTLLALTLAVGIVIDDAIVVLENIFRYIEEKGSSPFDAAIEARARCAAGDGHDAVAGRDLPAGCLHDRLRPPLHLPVRLDDGVRDPGVDARQLHADADAQLAFLKLADAEKDKKTKERGFFHLSRPFYARSLDGRCAPVDDHRRSSASFALTVPAEPDGRPHLRAQRGHGRVRPSTSDTPQGTSLEGTTEIARRS